MVVVALVVAVALGVHVGVIPDSPAVAASGGQPQLGMPHPTPGVESSDAPLGSPPAVLAGTGAYRFLQHQDDGVTPVAYDPCRPIHYVTRPDNAPVGGDQIVQSAVAEVARVTGFQFVDDGVTGEAPSDRREPYQPSRYGDRWAPVLITWDAPVENAELAGDVAGLGGSAYVSVGNGPLVYVTGTVELDAMQINDVLAQPNGVAEVRAIVLHELGHVVGLAHVDDPTQLMYPTTSDVWDFADGDLAGLAQLGAGPCEPDL